jgi:hypothetical protein
MPLFPAYTAEVQSSTRIDMPIKCIPGMHNHLCSRNHIIDFPSVDHIEICQISYGWKHMCTVTICF